MESKGKVISNPSPVDENKSLKNLTKTLIKLFYLKKKEFFSLDVLARSLSKYPSLYCGR